MQRNDIKCGDTVRVRGFQGVACWYAGPQTEPGPAEWECPECSARGVLNCEDCSGDGRDGDCSNCDGTGEVECWSCVGCGTCIDEEPEPVETGRALVVMVGDDHRHVVDYDDITPIAREEFCGACGQIGCAHDGLDRSEGGES